MAHKFIGIILITLLIVEYAAPVQSIKRWCRIANESKPKYLFGEAMQKLFNCAQCVGFWSGLIVYQDLYMAAIVSFSGEVLHRIVKIVYNRI